MYGIFMLMLPFGSTVPEVCKQKQNQGNKQEQIDWMRKVHLLISSLFCYCLYDFAACFRYITPYVGLGFEIGKFKQITTGQELRQKLVNL